jgi:NTE family protein
MGRRFILLLCALLASGCKETHFANTPLRAGAANPERRSIDPVSPDRPVILMAFSGGGSRATALAESVLRELSQTSYSAADGRHVLTEDIKFISAVSRGSITAAWFGLHRGPGHWDGDLDGLRDDFLTRDNMASLELDALDPLYWISLALGNFTRIEAEEALFDERLYHGATLAALNQPGRPLIVLSATDMAGGRTFAMTPRRFDDICSNYDALPVATAVAASAAVPVLLTPAAFKDHSDGCRGRLRNTDWAKLGPSDPYAPYLDLAGYREAHYVNDLRHGSDPDRQIDYLYFLDGGLANNLGTGALRSALIAPHDDAGVLRAINDGKIRRLVVIVVDAHKDPMSELYREPQPPGLDGQIHAMLLVPIDADSVDSQSAVSTLLDELARAAVRSGNQAKFAGMQVYGITADRDQIPADTPAHRALRDQATNIPTSWTLTGPQLQATEEAGRFLLRRHPCYRALLADLHATQPSMASEGPMPAIPCRTRTDVDKGATGHARDATRPTSRNGSAAQIR